ncbi:DUF7266 family protein [Halovenus sp. HT40]|uniref:DUF7266 family protein n=1 Tax=Halovenus sp. HT40 TaxID=3126691 RepID=UPI00300F461C
MTRDGADLRIDRRGLSVAVTHALTVAISTILVSGLIIGAGTLLESQEQSVGEDQLREVGSDAVTYVNTFDRLNGTGENVTVTVAPDYPERIVGSYRYTIQLYNTSELRGLEIRSEALGRERQYPISTTNARLTNTSTSGADVQISLCKNGEITVAGCGS